VHSFEEIKVDMEFIQSKDCQGRAVRNALYDVQFEFVIASEKRTFHKKFSDLIENISVHK
jgi:hypothetical protein